MLEKDQGRKPRWERGLWAGLRKKRDPPGGGRAGRGA